VNLLDAPLPPREDTPPGFAFAQASASERTGDELLGASLYEFEPGNQLWPYHWHSNNEEWLIVVTGTPTLRTPDGERELRPGDVVGFPDGEAGAHTLYNRSESVARVAIFSTRRKGSTVYLDSGKVSAVGEVYRLADAVDYWDGEESRA
jgi:uncharacterized cupin superfamily protein